MVDGPGAVMKIGFFLSQVLMLAIATFNLGRFSVEFSGSTAAWIGLACSLIVVAASLVALVSRLRAEA